MSGVVYQPSIVEQGVNMGWPEQVKYGPLFRTRYAANKWLALNCHSGYGTVKAVPVLEAADA